MEIVSSGSPQSESQDPGDIVVEYMVRLFYESQGGSLTRLNAWCICFIGRKVAARRGGDVPRQYWE